MSFLIRDRSDDRGMAFRDQSPVSDSKSKFDLQNLSDVKRVIDNRSVRVRLLLTAMIGLPYSHTTSLLLGLLHRDKRIEDSNGMDMYHALLFKDSVTNCSELRDLTDDEDKNDYMLLLSLAKFLVTKHYKLTILDHWKNNKLTFEDNPFRHDEHVGSYFEKFCRKLFKLMDEINTSELKMKLTQSHGFINFFDININKAAYEIVFILGSSYESVILFNVLNLYYYTLEKLNEPIEISDKVVGGSKEKVHLYELHKALEYYVHHIEGTFAVERERGNAILVGTHENEFANEEELKKRVDDTSHAIADYAERISIDKALASLVIIPVANNSKDDYEKVRAKYFELIDKDKKFEEYVPMKFMLLRCFLHSTGKPFITHEELKDYADKCGLDTSEDSSEVAQFLALFKKLCSLFLVESDPKLVVLQPTKLVKGLDLLYSKRESFSPTDRKQLDEGILTVEQARSFWRETDSENESISLYDFYTSVLTTLGLMIKVESDYFMPSLRVRYSVDKPTVTSDSMIIEYNVSLIPFHKQCEFVATFTKAHCNGITLKFKACRDYNVVKFECILADKVIAEASVRFRCEYLEVFVTGVSEDNPAVYALLKTSCIKVLTKFCAGFKALRYKLAIVCPKSKEGEPHFTEFDPLVQTHYCNSKTLCCDKCQDEFNLTTHPAGNWVTAAYLEHLKTAIQPSDVINPTNLIELCTNQLSALTVQEIITLHKKLTSGDSSSADESILSSLEKPDMLFRVLYQWHCKNPSATKRHLALHIQECGLQAHYKLDSSLFFRVPSKAELSTSFEDKEIFNITSSWGYGAEELAKVLKMDSGESLQRSQSETDQEMCSSVLKKWLEMTEGDRREKLADTFETEDYPSMSELIRNLPIH